jgi:hypothetical protein
MSEQPYGCCIPIPPIKPLGCRFGKSLKKVAVFVGRVILSLFSLGIWIILLTEFFHIIVSFTVIIAVIVGIFILSHFIVKYW